MSELVPRGIRPRIEELLRSVPVVILEGPRASGKTALGSMLLADGVIRTVVDLSDPTVRAGVEAAPGSFIDSVPTPAFIDEAQLVPELPLAVKRRVDRERTPGTFVLTGSSRLGRAQLGGSDPLAGRAARVRMWPMTQSEMAGTPVNLVDTLLTAPPSAAHSGAGISRSELLDRVRRGGLPPLSGLTAPIGNAVRQQLMGEYVEAVLYHEVGNRHDRAELSRLFQLMAATTSRLLNVSSVASEMGARRETVQARLASLESSFLVHLLAGHRPTEHRTLTAHPKVHVIDTGLAAWAAKVDDQPPAEVWGGLVETFVVNELVAQAGWLDGNVVVRHWRDTTRKTEVDAVIIEPSGESIVVEVKAASDIRDDDVRGLRSFLARTSGARRGVVIYTGELTLPLGDRIWAVPISALWNGLAAA